jgi:recombination protein RecA
MDARLRKLSELALPAPLGSGLDLDDLAGRFVELSGARSTGVLTAAFGLVLEAQFKGELAAWIGLAHSTFFAPDAHAGGVDLDALVVVRVPDAPSAGRAADQLLRSGGFGLVVIDLHAAAEVNSAAAFQRGAPAPRSPEVSVAPAHGPRTSRLRGEAGLPPALQSRLGGLAQKHDATVVALTQKRPEQPSLGPLVSLRAEAQRGPGFTCVVQALKDKRRPPGAPRVESCRPPDGATTPEHPAVPGALEATRLRLAAAEQDSPRVSERDPHGAAFSLRDPAPRPARTSAATS